jgi:F-type H+-transporting ATPase subunit delta
MSVKKNDDKKFIIIYSKAIFASGLDHNKLEEVAVGLKELQDLYRNVPELKKICTNQLLKYKQYQLVKILLSHIKATKLVHNFLLALASNHRLSLLPNIIEKFNSNLLVHNNEENIEVISYTALSADEIKLIHDKLEKAYAKKINLNTIIDKSLLGGIIIKQDSKILDFSLTNKLERMRKVTRAKIGSI